MKKEIVTPKAQLLWRQKGMPRSGWALYDVIDAGSRTEYCEFCGTDIRYVHQIYHPLVTRIVDTGCVCAEHLTQSSEGRALEKKLKARAAQAARRARNPLREWRQIRTGNFVRVEGSGLIFHDRKLGCWRVKLGDSWPLNRFDTPQSAAHFANAQIDKPITRAKA